MRRIIPAVLALSCASALAAPVNTTPNWKSYQQTGNPADIVSSPEVAEAIGAKVNAVNGQAQNLQIQGGTQTVTPAQNDNSTTIANTAYADRASQAAVSGKIDKVNGTGQNLTVTEAFTTPSGTFNKPQSGSNLGVGAQTYLAPNQVIQGSLSIRGDAPIIHLHSFLRPNMFDIWQDGSGAGNISVNDPIFGALNLYAHNVNIGGSSAGAVLDFYGGGSAPAMAMWQGSDGQGFIQTLGYNLNLSAGTGWIYFASPIQMSSGAIISDTTKCGSLSGAKGCISFRDAQGAVSYAPYFQ